MRGGDRCPAVGVVDSSCPGGDGDIRLDEAPRVIPVVGIPAALHAAFAAPATRYLNLDSGFDLGRDVARGASS